MTDFDIIFLSYSESNADKNWLDLKARFPSSKRVHGVQGIYEAHQEAARRSESDFFFIVDGDNRIQANFQFQAPTVNINKDSLYVWRALNPVNELVYGFGAVKLYNKSLIEKRKSKGFVDLATNVAPKYVVIDEIASVTHFHMTPLEAWRGAFRETAKLSAEVIKGQKSEETLARLSRWCNHQKDIINADWVRMGAEQGRAFGKDSNSDLNNLNDYSWLENEFAQVK